MTLYSDEIRALVRNTGFPKGLRHDIVEYDDYLALRFYRDNFETFDGVDKERTATQIQQLFAKVRGMGCPFYLEVAPGHGRD